MSVEGDPSPGKRRFRQIHRPGHPREGFPANHEFESTFATTRPRCSSAREASHDQSRNFSYEMVPQ